MSLLWMDYESEFQDLADTAFQCEREDNPDYFSSLSKRVQKIIHRDYPDVLFIPIFSKKAV